MPASLRGLKGFFGFPEMLQRNSVKRKHFRVISALRTRKGQRSLTRVFMLRDVSAKIKFPEIRTENEKTKGNLYRRHI